MNAKRLSGRGSLTGRPCPLLDYPTTQDLAGRPVKRLWDPCLVLLGLYAGPPPMMAVVVSCTVGVVRTPAFHSCVFLVHQQWRRSINTKPQEQPHCLRAPVELVLTIFIVLRICYLQHDDVFREPSALFSQLQKVRSSVCELSPCPHSLPASKRSSVPSMISLR